ncbi:MAG: hypothetical protein QM820_10180 [Minicystis sp.]
MRTRVPLGAPPPVPPAPEELLELAAAPPLPVEEDVVPPPLPVEEDVVLPPLPFEEEELPPLPFEDDVLELLSPPLPLAVAPPSTGAGLTVSRSVQASQARGRMKSQRSGRIEVEAGTRVL